MTCSCWLGRLEFQERFQVSNQVVATLTHFLLLAPPAKPNSTNLNKKSSQYSKSGTVSVWNQLW